MVDLDIELDLATAERLIALADRNLRVEAVERLTGGANSAVFDVRTVEGDSVVVKIYSDLFRWKMEKEVFVYDLLARRSVAAPVPVVLAADDSQTLLPQSFLVMTKLEGKHVLSLLDQLSDQELAAINREVAANLRKLHEVSFEEFGYVGTHGVVEPHPTNADYMRFQFMKKLREFDELGGDSDLRRKIEQYVADREGLLVGCSRASYCHNDCHEGNVLVVSRSDGWRVSGLLDFENVLAGDPLLDLAKTHCYSRRSSDLTLTALADGYGELRPDWRDALDLYVLYHWVELWDWFASIGHTVPLEDLANDIRGLCDAAA